MPWCEACAKYHTPSAMNDDGSCPVCGGPVATNGVDGTDVHAAEITGDESTPWHFKLLVGATVVYLSWRFVELFV